MDEINDLLEQHLGQQHPDWGDTDSLSSDENGPDAMGWRVPTRQSVQGPSTPAVATAAAAAAATAQREVVHRHFSIEHVTEEGDVYYEDTRDGSVTWEDPESPGGHRRVEGARTSLCDV